MNSSCLQFTIIYMICQQLIDEPEISLHITWQKQFLGDLLEVSKLIALHAIVATHSPQIVSSHLDIQIDLGELYGEELDTEQSN